MKQINFNHPGGFPLEQETLKRLQSAYRFELYEAFKEHLGLNPNENYIISYPASVGKNGWAIIHQNETDLENPQNNPGIQAVLYPISYISSSTDFLKTTRTESSLIFGSGITKSVYVDYKAEFVSASAIPANYFSSGNNPIMVSDKITEYYYNLNTFTKLETVTELADKFLPIDGSKPMEGDLKMGGHRLSNLDTNSHFSADVRSADFRLGYSERRGKLHPNDYLGRALVDASDDTKTNLHVNYEKDWENTVIEGKIKLPDVDASSAHATPLFIDDEGVVIKGSGQFGSNVPIGLIALWNGEMGPIPNGWTRCDGVAANGVTHVPNMSTFEMDPDADLQYNVFYIIYIGVSNIPQISAGNDQIVNLATGATVSGTITLNSTISPAETDTSGYTYVWTSVDGPIPTDDNNSSLVLSGVNPGNYSYRVTATTPSGLVIFDDVKVIVKSANTAPVINNINKILPNQTSILVDATGVVNVDFSVGSADLSLIANVTDPDGNSNTMTYEWIKLSGPAFGTLAVPTVINADTTSANVRLNASGLKETAVGSPYQFKFIATDIQGAKTERIIEINVTQTASLQITSTIPVSPSSKQFYTVRVSAKPNTVVALKADISQTDETGYASGTMAVKPNALGSNLTNINTNTYQTSTSVFNVNVGPLGYLDLICVVSSVISEYSLYADFEYVNPYEEVSNWVTGILSINTTDIDVVMYANNNRIIYTGGGTGGGSCFDVESPVLMASGQSKKLKNVVVGDKLQGLYFPNEIDESNGDYFKWNGKLSEGVKTDVTVISKRTALVPSHYEIAIQDGTVIKVTGEHPLLITQDGEQVQWLKVADIHESMSLIDKNGNLKSISSIVFKQEPLQIATLDVEDVDNYVIAGIVAHNKINPDQQ